MTVIEPWPLWNPQPSYPIITTPDTSWPRTNVVSSVLLDQGGGDYANEVEVDRGEHDAVLRFYRRRGDSQSLVKELTVPLGVLSALEGS